MTIAPPRDAAASDRESHHATQEGQEPPLRRPMQELASILPGIAGADDHAVFWRERSRALSTTRADRDPLEPRESPWRTFRCAA